MVEMIRIPTSSSSYMYGSAKVMFALGSIHLHSFAVCGLVWKNEARRTEAPLPGRLVSRVEDLVLPQKVD